MEALSAESSLPLIYALSGALRAPKHPTRRLTAVILMIMQEARDLSLRRSCLREVGERSRVFKEFQLDFGWESIPSHDDGRSQTFQNFLVFGGSLINLQISVTVGILSGGIVGAAIGLAVGELWERRHRRHRTGLS